jgi:nucleotide-binding universal stress UspA family protein
MGPYFPEYRGRRRRNRVGADDFAETAMKNILVLIHDDPGQEARLQLALDVTRMFNGHLMCLDVAIPSIALGDDAFGGGVGAILLAEEVTNEAANRTRLEQRLKTEGVSWEWADVTGRVAPSLRAASQFADLIVVNRRLDDFPSSDMRAVAGEVIARSGKPVFAVPESLRRFRPACAMIAWNGSTGSMAAVRHALPLLQHADRVFLTEVEGRGEGSAEAAASYLSRYDVHVRVERVVAEDGNIGRALIGRAVSHDAGYVIAGGFGHSRLTEALFGGVTRGLLTNAPCPVFMAH